MGEVSPRTSSGILPRSLDLVPRAGCTGPLGRTPENLDPERDNGACWEQLPFMVEADIPNARAASKNLYKLVEQLVSCEMDAHTCLDVHDGMGDPCTNASGSCSAIADCTIEDDDSVATCDVASQTAPVYTTNSDGTVTLTPAEAERLWAGKHQLLLQEFGDMMAAQASQYEEQLAQAFAGRRGMCST
jgi:hypothetical protein